MRFTLEETPPKALSSNISSEKQMLADTLISSRGRINKTLGWRVSSRLLTTLSGPNRALCGRVFEIIILKYQCITGYASVHLTPRGRGAMLIPPITDTKLKCDKIKDDTLMSVPETALILSVPVNEMLGFIFRLE